MAMKFVNQINFEIPVTEDHEAYVEAYEALDNNAWRIDNLVSPEEHDEIMRNLDAANWFPVSITGMGGNYTPGDPIGSYRASNYTQEYADVLWERIKGSIPRYRSFGPRDNTDYDEHELWEAVGVSPLLRFIRYVDGGWLVVHYDAPYVQDEETRTLQSLVIYLNHDERLKGGATRYLHDPQGEIPVRERELFDQIRPAREEEVRERFLPADNTGVIFDHRLLHDAERVSGEGNKTIIRTDILYRKVR